MSKLVTPQELAQTSDHLRNYDVQVYMYGFKAAKATLRVHVGLASTNHLETIKGIVQKHYDGQATIETIKVDTRKWS